RNTTATVTTSDNAPNRSAKFWTVRSSPISTGIPARWAMTPSPTVSRPITWPITTTITDIPVGGTTLRASASMFMATIGAGADSMDMEDFTAGAIPIGDMAGITPITVGAGAGTIPGGTTDGAGGAITDLG